MAHTIIETCTGCTACARKCPVSAIKGKRKMQHSIDPQLCIDCGVCGKICPSQAVLDEKGDLAQPVKPSLWPKPVWNYRACVECRICEQVCPTGSISLVRYHVNPDGLKPSHPFLYSSSTCIGCGFCERSCPTSAIRMQVPQKAGEPVKHP